MSDLIDELLGPIPEWVTQALCGQIDPERWFPEKGGSTRDAKKVCNDCPVRTECLLYALDNEERFGVWGGLSERERRALARENAAATGRAPDTAGVAA